MSPEIHIQTVELPGGDQQVTYAVQTVAGPYEKRFNILAATLADPAAVERAHAFFRVQLLADLRRLRDQLNGWEL